MHIQRKFITITVLFLALALPSIGNAAYWPGHRLKELIDAHDRTLSGNTQAVDYQKVGQLYGFVIGASDAVSGVLICLRPNAKVDQSVEIVKRYFKNHPEIWDQPAANLVIEALSQEFPCPR